MNKAEKKAIVNPDNPNGIYLYEYPVINGIKQYIQVRGTDRKNPLMLFIHGGPGGLMAGFTHFVHKGWEEKFTLVNWDQRNSCKTYFANKDKAREIAKTGTMADYLKDIDEIIAYLHGVYDFEKIIIVGFSWGSVIGAEYARCYPENVLCYIGIGQIVSYYDSLKHTCDKLSELAKDNPKELAQLEAFEKVISENGGFTKEFFIAQRGYMAVATKYLSKNSKPFPFKETLASPLLNFKEKLFIFKSDFTLYEQTFRTLENYDFKDDMNYKVPVLFVFGDEDFVCPNELIADCFDNITAPVKRFEVISKAGHSCFCDQPESYNEIINSFLTKIKAVQ